MTDREISVVAPASYGQERIWLATRLAPEATYHVCAWTLFEEPVSADRVRDGLRQVAARHESLRTQLELRDDALVQVVLKEPEVDLAIRDLPDLRRDEVMLGAGGVLHDLTREPFDTGVAPLWRSTLLHCADGDVLLTVAQHAIFDAGSQAIFNAELMQAMTGTENALPEIGLQPADVATWQRGQGAREDLDTGGAYWSQLLAGAPPVHELPLDGRRSEDSGQPGDDLFFRLPEGTSQTAAELGSRLGATEFMVAFAGFATFLHRVTGQDEVVVGVPVSDRDVTGAHGAIGMFVNTVVLRVDLSSDPTFTDVVGQVRSRMLEAWEHAHVPLQYLAERLEFERVSGAQPIYQIGFNHLGTTGLGRALGHAQDELFVELSEDDGRIEFRTDLLTEDTARRLGAVYGQVLSEVVAHPDQRVSRIDLLGGPLEIQASGPTRSMSSETVADQLGNLARHGARAAIRAVDDQLTYDEVDDWSARIAHDLVRRGCRRGDVVGLEAGRSLGLVPAVVGILRAGCAYLPLDPDLPPARQERMVALADARVSLRQSEISAMRSGPASRITASPVGPDDAAYVIFTSGSTGEPKGVVNTHRGLSNRLDWMQRDYALTPDDVVLHKTPTSFDVSVWELLWPLLHGATIAMAPEQAHRDPAEIERQCRQTNVTLLHFVPSMLAAFHASGAVLPSSVRQVICSGEALPGSLVRDVLTNHASLAIDNLYGPTEAAIDVTRHACDREVGNDVPIGRPVPNSALYVLDSALQALPVGAVGRLFIGGAQVARGYVQRPGLTAARFVPDPYAEPGTIMYDTGDRARWEPDGSLTYLGRADDQVKIRGQRIELGEVSAVLRSLAEVRDVAVVVRRDGQGDCRLAAYVVGDADPARLRAHAAETLPDVMVPSTITILDSLPTTANGKLDRASLPCAVAPEADEQEQVEEICAPEGPREEAISAAFADVLGQAIPGRFADFFAHGGHSLAAIRLITQIRDRTGTELPVSAVFSHPTVAQLAAQLPERREEPEIDDRALKPRTELRVADLDDGEVDEMLRALLAQQSVQEG